MEDGITERLQNFVLSKKETAGIDLDEKDITLSVKECSESLVGKIFGTKKVNFIGLKSTLISIWQTREAFAVREIGENAFQFVFRNMEDKDKVLRGKPWSFDNQYLLLKAWDEMGNMKVENFNSVKLWIQVWNLPLHWVAVDTGFKIGKLFENVLDVIIPEKGSIKGRFVKMLVEINLDKPLIRGTHINLGESKVWVDFRYENLLGFCFNCGAVGHFEKSCEIRKLDFQKKDIKNGQFGDWLRASEWWNFAKNNKMGQSTESSKNSKELREFEKFDGEGDIQSDSAAGFSNGLKKNISSQEHVTNNELALIIQEPVMNEGERNFGSDNKQKGIVLNEEGNNKKEQSHRQLRGNLGADEKQKGIALEIENGYKEGQSSDSKNSHKFTDSLNEMWQPMCFEFTGTTTGKDWEKDDVELINIPVSVGKLRAPLGDLSNKVKCLQNLGVGKNRKGKHIKIEERKKGKENMEGVEIQIIKNSNNKRSMRSSDSGAEEEALPSKKARCGEDFIDVEVAGANPEWPLGDQ